MTASSAGSPPSGLRRWARRAAWTAGGILVALVVLTGALLLVLQTESGATRAAQWVATSVNPLKNTRLTVEGASGSWLRSLRLTGVTLTRTDSSTGTRVSLAHVDTIAARYNLLPLFQGRLHVERISVDGPAVTMRQAADATWDWSSVLPAGDDADTSAAMSVRVDELRVANGAFTAAFYAEGRDSTAQIRDLELLAHDFRTASPVRVRVDTLGLRGGLPGGRTDVRLATRGRLSSRALSLDTLQLDSPRSRVRGHGAVRLPSGPSDVLEDVRFRLRASPFALRDLTPFVPTFEVDPRETVRLEVGVHGSGRRLAGAVDAQFSGGGTLTARADLTPRTTSTAEGPPLHYEIDAEIRRLTTSLLGPPDSSRNRLNGTMAVNLEGRSMGTLDGTADARLTDTRWGGLRTPELTLTSTLRDGAAALDVRGTLNDAGLRVRGDARPLAEAPAVDVTAQVRALDLAEFVPGAGIQSTLSASTQIRGRALGTTSQAVDVTVAFDSSRIGLQQIVDGRATLGLRPAAVRFDGGIALPGGRIEAAGFAALDGSDRFALERVRLEQANVAALLGDTTANSVTGTVRVDGRGFAVNSMRLETAVQLQDSFYGRYRIASLRSRATLDRAQVTTTADATLNGGSWTIALAGRPFAETPSFDLTQGRFRNVDVGPILRDTTVSTRLNGTLQGRVRGTEPQTMTVDGGVTLDTSRVNRQRIDAASLDVRLRGGQLDNRLTLDTPSGGVRLIAGARPFAEVPTYQIAEASFDGLDVGKLTGTPGLSTALSGALALEGQGTTASTLALDGDLSVGESRINDASLSQGRLRLTAKQGRATVDGQLAVGGGRVQVTGAVDSLTTTPRYEVRTSVRSLDAGALAGLDSLTATIDSLTWTLDGRGTDLGSLTASTQLDGRRVQIDRLTLDTLGLKGELRRGRFTLDTLHVQSDALESRGSGAVAVTDSTAESAFSIRTVITDARPLRRLVGVESLQLQRGVVTANVYGSSLATQRFDGTLEVAGLAYEDIRLTEGELDFNGRRGRDQWIQRFEVGGTLGYVSLPTVSADQTRLRVVYEDAAFDVSTQVRLDARHAANVNATIAPTAEQTEVTLTRVHLRMEEDRWSLLSDATITVSDHYQIRGFLLHSGPQQIAADGIVDFTGTQSLVVTVEEVRLGAFSPVLGFGGVDGTLTGSVDLTGPATAPRLSSRLSLELRTENRDVGTLRLATQYRDFSLDLDADLTHTDGATLTADGAVPTDLRLRAPSPADVESRPVRIDVTTNQFPVDWIDPFLDPATVRNVRGVLTADVDVRGTLDSPMLAGTASLTGGGASLRGIGTRYDDGTATLRFTDNRIVLDRAVVRSRNDGRLRAEGVINFPQLTVGEYDLDLRASRFLAIDTRAYREAIVGGGMTLRGTIQRPVLSGNLTVRSADIYYNEALAASGATATAVPLSERDRLTLENRFGIRLTAADTTTFDAYEALKMDLGVRIQRNTWLRSRSTPEMNVQFTGDLDVTKEHDEDPQVFGTIEVGTERSTLRQFGQEFQITEGTLTFNGDPYTPYLILAAVYEQRAQGAQGTEVRITLTLEGRPEDLSPTLSSDPPMDTRNILSYLATGRPADELLSGGEGGGRLATQVALGQATNFVENLAASELGLDVVRLQIRTSGLSYLTVGRYFTPRLFVSIQQPVTTGGATSVRTTQSLPDLTVEYELLDTLMLRALNNQQSLQLDLLFEYAY